MLDNFARDGVRFTDCYASAPVCSPSRAGLLTGRAPDRTGVYDWIPGNSAMHLRQQEVTFARVLKDAGYTTCHVGKWHLNGLFNSAQQPQPGDHGFDHWFSTQNNAAPTHMNPVNFVRDGQAVGPVMGNSSSVIVDEALSWLGRVPKEKPYCLFVCFHAPHEPISTDREFLGLYARASGGQAQYYGSVSELDQNFGRLMRYIDESRKQRDETFVMFTSDNGPETLNRYPDAWRSYGSPGPLRGMKLHMYEGGYRVPGIARWPRAMKQGSVSAEPVSNVDILPTLCSLAGAKLPSGRTIDGANILPALEGKPLQRQVPLHWHYFNAMSAPVATMRDGDWKVLGIDTKREARQPGAAWKPESMAKVKAIELNSFELYNLKEDPAEKNNLAEKDPKRLKQMSDRLTKLQREVKAEGVSWNG